MQRNKFTETILQIDLAQIILDLNTRFECSIQRHLFISYRENKPIRLPIFSVETQTRRKRSSTDYPLFHPYKDEQGRRIEVQGGTDKNSRIGRKLGRESRKVPSRIQFSRDQATRSVVALEIGKLKRLASPDYRR